MDYKELASRCLKRSKMEYEDATMIMLECSAKAITDLLERAEAAEARAEKAERECDAAVRLCGKLIALCSPPKEWRPKLFQKHINRAGDYMGYGYDFLDSFNRIYDNFSETVDDELYIAIRDATEKEILKWSMRVIGTKE